MSALKLNLCPWGNLTSQVKVVEESFSLRRLLKDSTIILRVVMKNNLLFFSLFSADEADKPIRAMA